MRKRALAFLVAIFVIIQTASEVLPSSILNFQIEEYAIYSAILDSFEQPEQGKVLFVIDHTSESFDMKYLLEEYNRQQEPNLLPSTLLDFRRKRIQKLKFIDEFETTQPYQLLNKEEFDETFKDGCLGTGWCDFYKRYDRASGIMRFSKVGFSRDGSQALVYVGFGCGGLCGWGGYRVLRKQDGIWKFEKGMVTTVS